MTELELFQFAGSHYNEKARWALDWKGLRHQRISLLPGPHAPTMKALTGSTQTPALRHDGSVIPGSTAILEHLEAGFPEPALFPPPGPERERALAIVRRFDDEVGPAVRLAKFFEVMEAAYALGTFCADRGPLVRAGYRLAFPLVGRVMRRSMGIEAAAAERSRAITSEALEFVAKEAGPEGYLVADRFSVADLTAASLLMPAVDVSAWGGPLDASTARNRAWLDRWTAHPGAEWVRTQYRRHRRPGAGSRAA